MFTSSNARRAAFRDLGNCTKNYLKLKLGALLSIAPVKTLWII